MRHEQHFWWTTLIRGFLSLLAGSAIMVLPDMARTVLLLPLAMAASILGLAVYGVLDGVLVFITSFMTGSQSARRALRMQGFISVVVGSLLYLVFFNSVQLRWFLTLVAMQSLCTAIAELYIARTAITKALLHWNFAAAAVALAFSVVYFALAFFFAAALSEEQISWLVYGYLLAFGIAQCMTSARMLYADRPRNLASAPPLPFQKAG